MSTHEVFEAQLDEELMDRLSDRALPDAFFEVTDLKADDLSSSILRLVNPEVKPATEAQPGDFQVERIIQAFKRPSLLVRDNSFEPVVSETWAQTLELHRSAIESALPAVGRIELKNHSSFRWVGTGFLVDSDVLVTNRHVAREFVRRDGADFTWRHNHRGKLISARIDFREEHELPVEQEFDIQEVLHVEDSPGPDMAFLRIVQPNPPIRPLQLQDVSVDHVGAVGYPWRDSRVEAGLIEAMERIFQGIFDVKRFAPGFPISVPTDDLGHDCTTLGGNSGSAIIDLATGAVVGLHYGGYSDYNVAVPVEVLKGRLESL